MMQEGVKAAFTSVEQHQNRARLIADLTGPKYNKTILPASNCQSGTDQNCPFVVVTRLFLMRIQDLLEDQETLASTVRIQLGWIDPALTWNPDDYQGVTSVTLQGDILWVPELQLANSVDDMYGLLSSKNFDLRLTNDGQVWWHPTGKILTRCALDLTYYPFDYQRCSIVIESATYPSPEMQIIPRQDRTDHVSLGMFTNNELWSLVGATGFPMQYKSGNTPFSRVHFWLIIKRDSSYYQNMFLIPIALLSVLQTFTFLIPMHMADRVSQATVVLLSAFVLESYITDRLPESSQHSLVLTYINILIAVSVATIGVCVVTLGMMEPDEGLDYWGVLRLIRYFRKKHARRVSAVHGGVSSSAKARHLESSHYHKNNGNNNNEGDNADDDRPISKNALVAAIINSFGFFSSVSIAVIYPSAVFAGYVVDNPPQIPQPTPDNISLSYYAEV